MPKYLTSSTLWYSGIFAAAATWDAGLKQQRREKWDNAIAEVRQELGQPIGIEQAQKEASEKRELVEELAGVNDQVDEGPMQFDPFTEKDEDEGFNYADGRTRAKWPANTGAPLIAKYNAPNSIYAEDWQRDIVEHLKWTPKKLAMTQTSADILLLELMQQLQTRGDAMTTIDSVPADFQPEFAHHLQNLHVQISSKQARLRVLRRAHFDMSHYTLPEEPEEKLPIPTDDHPICDYQEDAEHRFRSTQRELNSSLHHLFKLHRAEGINTSTLIGKIIYNLRYSSAPPNINTFNTLLLGFSRADEPEMVLKVARSLRRCHQRPNEITLATVLNTFTKENNPVGFTRWINLIRGKNSGLYLARPDVEITDARKERLLRHPQHPERTIQLPYHTPVVFGAIIAGVLKFTGFEPALQICQSMGQEGWGLCMAGLTPLLHNCMQRSDWTSGLAVWKQVLALKAKSRRRQDGVYRSEKIRLDTFATMLRLCLKCDRRDIFDEVWTAAVKSHRGEGVTQKLMSLVKGVGKKGKVDLVDQSIVEAARATNAKPKGPSDVPRVRKEEMTYWEFSEIDEPSGMDEVAAQEVRADDSTTARDTAPSRGAMVSTHFDGTSEFLELSNVAQLDLQASVEHHAEEKSSEMQEPDQHPQSHKPKAISLPERKAQIRFQSGNYRPRTVHHQVRQEELQGLLPAGRDLSEYEVRERPMALRA